MARGNVYLIPDKRMNRTVSHLKGVRGRVRSEAEEMGARASAKLAPHRYTGDAHIEVSQGDVDSFVSLVDEAALSIEFGHLSQNNTWVRGLRILADWYHEGLDA